MIFLPKIFFSIKMSSLLLEVRNRKTNPDTHIGSGFTTFYNNYFRIKHFVMGICLTWVRRKFVLSGYTVSRGIEEHPTHLATRVTFLPVVKMPITFSRLFWR